MDLLALPERYRLILCDLWGCVHDGATIFPGVPETLAAWRLQGRKVLLVTNAPRSAAAVRAQLSRLRLGEGLDDGIVTAGDAAVEALRGRSVGFCGTEADRRDLEGKGLTLVDENFDELACAGLEPDEGVEDYRAQLACWREDDVLLHCLNPDRIVQHQGRTLICAGALADAYEALGGRVAWYGKPFPSIYELALSMAGVSNKAQVVAIGDGLQTDMAGAAAFGIDGIFVAGGIHAGEEPVFPGGWHPIGIVDTIGTVRPPRT